MVMGMVMVRVTMELHVMKSSMVTMVVMAVSAVFMIAAHKLRSHVCSSIRHITIVPGVALTALLVVFATDTTCMSQPNVTIKTRSH